MTKKISEQEKLKKQIQGKFGTMSKFCVLSGYNRNKLQILLAVKNPSAKELRKVSKLSYKTKLKESINEIDDYLRKQIKLKLDSYGGIAKFCSDHSDFPVTSVYQILDGRRTRISNRVRQLCSKLNIEI